MTPNHPDAPDDPDDSNDSNESTDSNDAPVGRRGITGALRSLVETLADMERHGEDTRVGSGAQRDGNKRVDYGYSVHIGSGRPVERGHADAGERGRRDTADRERADDAPPRNVVFDSRHDGLDTIVVADVPGTDPGAVETRLVGDRLDVRVAGDLVGRLHFDRDDLRVVEERFANGVLTVRLRPPEVEP